MARILKVILLVFSDNHSIANWREHFLFDDKLPLLMLQVRRKWDCLEWWSICVITCRVQTVLPRSVTNNTFLRQVDKYLMEYYCMSPITGFQARGNSPSGLFQVSWPSYGIGLSPEWEESATVHAVSMFPHRLFGTVCRDTYAMMTLVRNSSLTILRQLCLHGPIRQRHLWECLFKGT